ncbi:MULTISPECIES: MFS transporter [Brevibacillus]|uniref:MFS transporter n=1 Tax=Brevibacillus TaxID=55080 RepID=UPI00203C8687|nr:MULTISPECIES: MFS transporter [Brevibacillus]MCM3428208.1 MFS transporter [Brevibacillus invocatus]MDH4617691.1 MFS transporter [Brevibacillus sp. AY1]
MMKRNVFTPLRNRSYRTFFLSQIFADLGNWLDLLAIGALITFTWNLGLAANSAAVIAMGAPFLFVGPLASVWVDRLSCRTVLLLSTGLRILVIAGFLLAPNLYVLLPLIFLKSSLASVIEPARQSMLRHLVDQEEMAEASSLGQMVNNGMKMIGPALGGLLLTYSSTTAVFAVEGVLFVIALLIMLRLPFIPAAAVNRELDGKPSFTREVTEGIRFLFGNRLMRSAVMIVGLSMFIIFLYDGFFPPLIKLLGLDVMDYGLVTAALGCGSVCGALLVGQFTAWRRNPILFMAFGRIVSGLQLLIVAGGAIYGIGYGNTIFWVINFAFAGAVGVGMTVPYAYLIQTQTPPELIGRVSAVAMAVQGIAILTAPSIGAVLGEWLGLGWVFGLAGALTVLLGVASTLQSREKKDLTVSVRS